MANVPNLTTDIGYTDKMTERRTRQIKIKRLRCEVANKITRTSIGCAILCAALFIAQRFGLLSIWLAAPISALALAWLLLLIGGSAGYIIAKEEGDEWKS